MEFTHTVSISKRWNLRYGEIKSRIDNITDAVLAASLKVPISSQMIVRQSYDEIRQKSNIRCLKKADRLFIFLTHILSI